MAYDEMETPEAGAAKAEDQSGEPSENAVPFPPEMGYKVGDVCSFRIVSVDEDGWAHGEPIDQPNKESEPPTDMMADLRSTMGEERT